MQPARTPDTVDQATDYINALRAVPDELLAFALRNQPAPRKLNRMEMRALLAVTLPAHARLLATGSTDAP